MVMAKLSDTLWSINSLDTLKHGHAIASDPDHLYGNPCLDLKGRCLYTYEA